MAPKSRARALQPPRRPRLRGTHLGCCLSCGSSGPGFPLCTRRPLGASLNAIRGKRGPALEALSPARWLLGTKSSRRVAKPAHEDRPGAQETAWSHCCGWDGLLPGAARRPVQRRVTFVATIPLHSAGTGRASPKLIPGGQSPTSALTARPTGQASETLPLCWLLSLGFTRATHTQQQQQQITNPVVNTFNPPGMPQTTFLGHPLSQPELRGGTDE